MTTDDASRYQHERMLWMARMEDAGWPWEQIAADRGYASADSAKTALSRWLASKAREWPDQRRAEMRAHISELEDQAWDKLSRPPEDWWKKGC